MFKALLRLLSMILLAIAVIMAVLDATRSIAAGALVMTPLGTSWVALSPESFGQFEVMITSSLPDFVWNPLLLALLLLPGFAVFALLSLLLAMVGHKRKRHSDHIAA